VVNRSIKGEGPDGKGHFAARLVVCLGTNVPQQYRCEILPTLHANEIRLPYWADLELLKIEGEIPCGAPGGTTSAYYPEGWKGTRPLGGETDVPALKARLKHDAIGEYAIGSNPGGDTGSPSRRSLCGLRKRRPTGGDKTGDAI
jgi:hypothetical protein